MWEALMSSSNKKLDNLTLIVDKNNLQIDGDTDEVKSLEPLDKKLEAFGWLVKTVDGHNEAELETALKEARDSKKLCAVVANTIKGKGVSFMEDNANGQGKAPNDDELKRALEELNA